MSLRTATYVPIIAVSLALGIAGCASTLSFVADTFDVEVVPDSVKAQAYKAANVSFVAWEHVQLLMLEYGRLPKCVDQGPVLCRSDRAWAKIKDIDFRTTAALNATRPIIEAGTDDVQLLMAVPALVHDAKKAFEEAKVEE